MGSNLFPVGEERMETMERFKWWLKSNALALVVASLMFAVMACMMGGMIDRDLSSLLDLFGDWSKRMTSPFLWTWRLVGMATWWPVFYRIFTLRTPFFCGAIERW